MSREFAQNYYSHNHHNGELPSLNQSQNRNYYSSTSNSFDTDINQSLYRTNHHSSSYSTSTHSQNQRYQKNNSRQFWDFDWDFFGSDTPNTSGYSAQNGYGLVDASSAVAKAAGKDKFADAPEEGGNNWGADMVKAPSAWSQGYTGEGVVVAVLDTGVDRNHEDLKNNIWKNSGEIADNGVDDDGNGYVDDVFGWNFDSNNSNTLDVDGHGTHVSGTIAAEKNSTGGTGVAYGAKIMPVKVLDDNGSGTNSAIAKGIYYAVGNGARVINLSLGGGSYNQELEQAVQYASSKNVIVVMAAGNSGGSQPIYPARYAEKSGVAVGAVNRNGQMADFSNRSGNKQISYVTAPGVSIFSTLPSNQYGSYSGTSMATPHVAGVVALMLSANPGLSDNDVRNILADTSKNSASTPSQISISSSTNPLSYGNNSLALTPGYDLRYDLSEGDSRFVSFPKFDDKGLPDRFNNLTYGGEVRVTNRESITESIQPIQSELFTNNYLTNNYLSSDQQQITAASNNEILDPELWNRFQTERQQKQAGTQPGNGNDNIMDPDLFNRERDRILLEYRDWLRLLPVT